VVLTLIEASRTSLNIPNLGPATAPPSPSSVEALAEAATSPATGTGSLVFIALLAMFACLGAALYLGLRAANHPILAYLNKPIDLLGKFSVPTGKNKPFFKASDHDPEFGPLYYKTAIGLGARVAAADWQASSDEFETLTRVFGLTDANCPKAREIYQKALDAPKPLSDLLKPFLTAYGKNATNSEPLIFGMTCVALADGEMTPSELGIINLAAEALGISAVRAKRVIMSAGYFGEDTGGTRQSGTYGSSNQKESSNRYSSRSASKSEKELHLETLGLTAAANQNEIRSAWRKLVSKYHPDKLVSQGLSSEEMDEAEDKIQAINEAYDWLKEYAA